MGEVGQHMAWVGLLPTTPRSSLHDLRRLEIVFSRGRRNVGSLLGRVGRCILVVPAPTSFIMDVCVAIYWKVEFPTGAITYRGL
jgi:hypothetical protein